MKASSFSTNYHHLQPYTTKTLILFLLVADGCITMFVLQKHAYVDFLKVSGWHSEYRSVENMLVHLARKTRSESSRVIHLRNLHKFCLFCNKTPDELVEMKKKEIEVTVQRYSDSFNDGVHSPHYVNSALSLSVVFFIANGFRKGRALDVHRVYVPPRYRKSPEYIPTKNEIFEMADCAGSLRDRAIILALFSSGLRNSTLRALLFSDVKAELMNGVNNIRLPVYPEMKSLVPSACKRNIPYYTFICDEASKALRLYVKERIELQGGIRDTDPLFASSYNQISKIQRNSAFLSQRELQYVVKFAARGAGIAQWSAVHPHCLRKAFETVLHSPLIDGTNLDGKVQTFLLGHLLASSDEPYFDKSKVEEFRTLYAKLNFGRVVIENKFKTLKVALAKAFEGTGMDYEQVLQEYVVLKRQQAGLVADAIQA